MSHSKLDYFHFVPDEIKKTIFSFFTPKELCRSNLALNKAFNKLCSESTESYLKIEYEKIKKTRLCLIELAQERERHFECFPLIDTYEKYTSVLFLNPNDLTFKDSIVLIKAVSKILAVSGATFSLQQLIYKNNPRIQLLFKDSNISESTDYDQWFMTIVSDIRQEAINYGQFEIIKNFFPDVLNSSILQAIVYMVMTTYNSHPHIDSGVDSDSEEGKHQIERFDRVQQFGLTLLSNCYDDYKQTIQLLIGKGITVDSEDDKLKRPEFLPSKEFKRWYKKHQDSLPESIIELLDLIVTEVDNVEPFKRMEL